MTLQTIFEIIGYTGSFLVIVSMLMTSVVKLRVINTIGSVIFAVYALCIHSYPTAAMQVCLIVINIISLYKLLSKKNTYSVLPVSNSDSMLAYFYNEYSQDILQYFPDFDIKRISAADDDAAKENNICAYLIMCGATAAGLFVGSKTDDAMNVWLDYATPAYRDCSVGKYLYDYLVQNGFKRFRTATASEAHKSYLSKMGFKLLSDKEFEKVL